MWVNIAKKRIKEAVYLKEKGMDYIRGIDRQQMYFTSVEDFISVDNMVRFIDYFVEQIDLEQLGFKLQVQKSEGRPSYCSKVFMKLYLYGYINGIRSSRNLERECMRNVEVQWLLCKLVPNYHSIADFRKVNGIALRQLFKLYVLFLKDEGLITGKVLAVDGTKSRASNSKKNNYNAKKIERHLEYIEKMTAAYMEELEQNDNGEQEEKTVDIQQKIERLSGAKLKYELLSKQLAASGEPQVSTTDPDARALLVQGQVVEVAYNVQAAVDGEHKLVAGTHTINRNDRNALRDIAIEAKENIGVTEITVLADKGYHNARQLSDCSEAGITTIVAQQEIVNSNEGGTTPAYMVTKFVYDSESDTYRCPAGEVLTTKGTWHRKARDYGAYQYKKYRTSKCKDCAVRHLCTGRQKGGREIERSEFAEVVAANGKRCREQKALYRKRQEWNEHIFGTIKRQWGYNYTNLRGLEKVNGEHSLIMLVYNMKRSVQIMGGVENLIARFRAWTPKYPPKVKNSTKEAKIAHKIIQIKPFWRLKKLVA